MGGIKNMAEKKRLDTVVVDKGLIFPRSRARAEIMAGNVLVDGKVCDKPGTPVNPAAEVALLAGKNPYVSRGGLKLAGAYEDLGLSFKDKIILDAGASTGGFTDFALQNGASKVYAVDVGYGQLDWKLRQDSRVVNMERTNIRYLRKEDLHETPCMALADVSFISLQKVLPVFNSIGIAEIVLLVKPQFEAGREKVGKKGVVRDPEVHHQVLDDIKNFAGKLNLQTLGSTPSRLKGPQGNIEFFLHLGKA